jgi:hypothetical protein
VTLPGMLGADGADAGVVIDQLPTLIQQTVELQHIGRVSLDLVTGAIAADHDISGHFISPELEGSVCLLIFRVIFSVFNLIASCMRL